VNRGGTKTSVAGWTSGEGDNYTIVFDPAGVLLLGFYHESGASPWRDGPQRAHWPGLLDGVPPALAPYLHEPAFLSDGFLDITVCAWCEREDGIWRCGPVDLAELEMYERDPDGALWMFGRLTDEADGPDDDTVRAILTGRPLTPQLIRSLNPLADAASVLAKATAMGYPTS
jgi:hypothetical protein